MAQHGLTSGARSDDDGDLSPRIAEAGLSMHVSVTYHSPNWRKKSNLLSLFSVQDLPNDTQQLSILGKETQLKSDFVLVNTLTCGRHMIWFPSLWISSWKHYFDGSDILLWARCAHETKGTTSESARRGDPAFHVWWFSPGNISVPRPNISTLSPNSELCSASNWTSTCCCESHVRIRSECNSNDVNKYWVRLLARAKKNPEFAE